MTEGKVKKAKIEESVKKEYNVTVEVNVGTRSIRIAFIPRKKNLPYAYLIAPVSLDLGRYESSVSALNVIYIDWEKNEIESTTLPYLKGQFISHRSLPPAVENLIKYVNLMMKENVPPYNLIGKPVIPEFRFESIVPEFLSGLSILEEIPKFYQRLSAYSVFNILSSKDRHKASLDGVSSDLVARFMDRFDLTKRDLSALLGINERTLYTQLKEDKLDEKNSDRFLLIESVFEEGVDALMSEKAFIEWLHTPHSHFDKETPFSLLTTINGAEAVREELIRTKYGVLS